MRCWLTCYNARCAWLPSASPPLKKYKKSACTRKRHNKGGGPLWSFGMVSVVECMTLSHSSHVIAKHLQIV
jgi:hypothetical protein